MSELAKFGSTYFFLSLISLRAKLTATPLWFDGSLARHHELLLAFQGTNHEQSRLLQFYIPHALHQALDIPVVDAYVLQRWAFTFAAFVGFHFYLRRWFGAGLAFAGVAFLAAVMPLTYLRDLQESTPLLLVTFLAALWAIRERRTGWYAAALALGALNNETVLILPAVYFLYRFESFAVRPLARLSLLTLASGLPALAIAASVRYMTRDRPVLGGAWHLPENLAGVLHGAGLSPLQYFQAGYLFFVFLFGAFWLFAFLRISEQPLFLRRAALIVPLFVAIHMVSGVIVEVRQMLPLAFILVPLALGYLFPRDAQPGLRDSR